jgi:hypothetical protein
MNNCVHCKAPINEATDWQEIRGWQRKAHSSSRRGGSDIAQRTTTDSWACSGCLHLMKLGIPVGQDALFAENSGHAA